MKRESNSHRVEIRKRLLKEQNFKCAYCGRKISDKGSLDHIIPVDLTEFNYGDSNLIVTCIPCNKRKSNHIIFSLIEDKKVYPMLHVPYFFRVYDIQYNFKDKK